MYVLISDRFIIPMDARQLDIRLQLKIQYKFMIGVKSQEEGEFSQFQLTNNTIFNRTEPVDINTSNETSKYDRLVYKFRSVFI